MRIDQDSLPEGVAVEEGEDAFTKTVGRRTAARPRCSSSARTCATSRASGTLLPQTLANGLKLAMIIAITSIGLSLIFGTTGLSNFAHGEMVTFGALIAWLFNREIGWHLISGRRRSPSWSPALARARCMELGIWRPLRRRETSLTSMMIVSIGVALAAPLPVPVLLRRRRRGVPAVHAASPIPVDRPDRPRPAIAVGHGHLGRS